MPDDTNERDPSVRPGPTSRHTDRSPVREIDLERLDGRDGGAVENVEMPPTDDERDAAAAALERWIADEEAKIEERRRRRPAEQERSEMRALRADLAEAVAASLDFEDAYEEYRERQLAIRDERDD